jgi:hypothetical protein
MMIVDIGGELILETTNLQMPGRIGIHISMPSDDDEECYPVAWFWPGPRPTMPRKPTQPAYTTHISGTTDVKKYEKSIIINRLQVSTLLVIGFSLRFVA